MLKIDIFEALLCNEKVNSRYRIFAVFAVNTIQNDAPNTGRKYDSSFNY